MSILSILLPWEFIYAKLRNLTILKWGLVVKFCSFYVDTDTDSGIHFLCLYPLLGSFHDADFWSIEIAPMFSPLWNAIIIREISTKTNYYFQYVISLTSEKTAVMYVHKDVHYQVKNTDCMCLGHIPSNTRSLQENSQSELAHHCSHTIKLKHCFCTKDFINWNYSM